eukprot:1133884-Alexandrium_andersonii.AAC.1
MSASLVGSEMCIRDRARAVSGHSIKAAGLLEEPAELSPGGAPFTDAAVSYTHLTLPTICSV